MEERGATGTAAVSRTREPPELVLADAFADAEGDVVEGMPETPITVS